VDLAVTMDLKEPGNLIYLLGETKAELGGSHWSLITDYQLPLQVPDLPPNAPALYRALHRAMLAGLVRACHDLSEGGLAVAAAEMGIGGRLGLALTLEGGEPVTALFSESNGRLLAEVRPDRCAAFEAYFAGLPITRLGLVTGGPRLSISGRDRLLVSLPLEELVKAWTSTAS
jgi:phosphoribosylformylglycinamidine synthase